MVSLREPRRVRWIDADQDTALTARANRQVPIDQERQAAEHPPFGESALAS
jgi:hypothetical protein